MVSRFAAPRRPWLAQSGQRFPRRLKTFYEPCDDIGRLGRGHAQQPARRPNTGVWMKMKITFNFSNVLLRPASSLSGPCAPVIEEEN